MKNTDVIDAWRKVIEGNNEFELTKREECDGTGFSKSETGYDSICDNCSGKGEIPKLY